MTGGNVFKLYEAEVSSQLIPAGRFRAMLQFCFCRSTGDLLVLRQNRLRCRLFDWFPEDLQKQANVC